MTRIILLASALFASATLTAASADAEQWVYTAPECTAAQAHASDAASLLPCFVPVYTIEDGSLQFNRIGTPEIRMQDGRERVSINPDRHTVYVGTHDDRIGERDVVHLLYRIHFTEIPFRWKDVFLKHRNAGLLTLVTLDAESFEPLFVTTVFTCGCYRALLPTELLPEAALPDDYPSDQLQVWGETLEPIIAQPTTEDPLLVSMRSHTHRVYDMSIVHDRVSAGVQKTLELRPIEELHELPVIGGEGETSSFYYTSGFRRGHVRGAWSPVEGLTLGLLILDPMIGMDKDFGDPELTGTKFYTMLTPWSRDVSRLDQYDPLLQKLGYHTSVLTEDRKAASPGGGSSFDMESGFVPTGWSQPGRVCAIP